MIRNMIISLFLLMLFSLSVSAHKGNKSFQKSDSINYQSQTKLDKGNTFSYQSTHNTGTLADFPRLHPMIVHFPIVLLLLAFITQVCSFFFLKKELGYITLVLVAGGFAGAYIAAFIIHGGDPNLKTLDAISRSNFEQHELYAYYTVWLSGIATLVKTLSQFVFKKHLISEILVTLLLVGSAYTITVTGDMGARLVHIDAIGVQGNKIPAHDDD